MSDIDDLRQHIQTIDAKVSAVLEILADQRTRKEWYTTTEAAEQLGKTLYTVREWCRLRRINAVKRPTGRGRMFDWAISHEELERIRNHGILPMRLADVTA